MRMAKNMETKLVLWGVDFQRVDPSNATTVQNLGKWAGTLLAHTITLLKMVFGREGLSVKWIIPIRMTLPLTDRVGSGGKSEPCNGHKSNLETDPWVNSQLVAKLGAGESATLPHFYLWDSLELTVNEINLNANPAYADVTVQLKCGANCGMTNPELIGATLDSWTGISGDSIADLMRGTNNLVNTPDKSVRLTGLLEGTSNDGDNYGSRMKGWLRPPVSGDYKFWIASDDNGELWLSTDDNPASKRLACHQPFSSWSRYWTMYPEQESKLIPLVAGKAYYYEVSK